MNRLPPMLLLVLLLLSSGLHARDESLRGMQHLGGGLYLFQDDNNTYSAFLVTQAGIILADPIDSPTARWLKKEIDERFGLPVKYLLFSHHHYDHISGVEVFPDALIVAHDNVVPHVELWNDHDRPITDLEQDDFADEAELLAYRRANPQRRPDITFSDRLSVSLGGQTVEMQYIGKSHGDSMVTINFLDEKTLLAVDTFWIDRVAYADLPFTNYFPGWIEALYRIEQQPFERILASHGHWGGEWGAGAVGTREHLVEFMRYFEALYEKVKAAREAGLSREQAVEQIELPEYRHLGKYDDWFEMNVAAMYEQMVR